MTTAVRERSLILRPHEVKGILAGRQTQVRRPMKPQSERQPVECGWVDSGWALEGLPNEYGIKGCSCSEVKCPFGVPGDRLWCRESFSDPFPLDIEHKNFTVFFRATDADRKVKWRSPIHMPRWASRITLELTEVRVERLQAISEVDARAEGMERFRAEFAEGTYRYAFIATWDYLNGKRPGFSWADNPWVWCLSFRRIEKGGGS